ncbi:MAG: nucleoside triphosphate pyrophosphohydrolase [Ignavibacteriales bacterium CG07_land_8_20_14_0_80_59_12]|nr:MAG: nucleoside triphosphate pyrophosphohydrolase [Ignavibacteriales bacterium CG07_land_8_20_14_0_80_59_12]
MGACMDSFDKFVEVVRRLRKECPWDREQTHESIKHLLIEEAYEAVESVDRHDLPELKKELGDLLLHIAMHSVIAEEERAFSLDDVITGITEKLIHRHPHVFGDVRVSSDTEVEQNWERLKKAEGRESVIEGIPKSMPALLKAQRLQEKVSNVGFDWGRAEDAWKKVEEELREMQESASEGNAERLQEEYGDLLFALVNYARFVNVTPENALRSTIDKFSRRFRYIEGKLAERGTTVHDSTLEEMEALWEEAKKMEWRDGAHL